MQIQFHRYRVQREKIFRICTVALRREKSNVLSYNIITTLFWTKMQLWEISIGNLRWDPNQRFIFTNEVERLVENDTWTRRSVSWKTVHGLHLEYIVGYLPHQFERKVDRSTQMVIKNISQTTGMPATAII